MKRRPVASEFFNHYRCAPPPPPVSDRDAQPTSPFHLSLDLSHVRPTSLEPTTRMYPADLPLPVPDHAEPPSTLTFDPAVFHSPIIDGLASAAFPSTTTTTTDLLASFHDRWSSTFTTDLSWDDFFTQCSDFASSCLTTARAVSETQQHRSPQRRSVRPNCRPFHSSRHRILFDAAEAKRLQMLYRHSHKRAGWKMLGDNKPFYTGSPNDAHSFFTKMFQHNQCDTSTLIEELNFHVPSIEVDENLFSPPTAYELQRQLASMANSAPDQDRVEYHHLRFVDKQCKIFLILSLIFRCCFIQREVTAPWKTATIILYHKKGPSDCISNFRPIALMSCLYKRLMAILARRISQWATSNGLLSNDQGSARPTEGCYEHGFLLQSLVGDALSLQLG